MSLEQRLDRIRTALGDACEADPSLQHFGSEEHEYRLVPPLDEDTLIRVEHQLKIGLPAAFRGFLLEIGSGGAGPGYGLQRVDPTDSADRIPKATPRVALQHVAQRPGSVIPRVVWLDAVGQEIPVFDLSFWDAIKELVSDPGAPSRPFPCAAPFLGDAADPPASAAEADLSLVPDGSMFLADYGCGIGARIVLNGPFRGDVWVLDESAGGYVPFGMMHVLHSANGERADGPRERYDFLDWYEDWLHQLVAPE